LKLVALVLADLLVEFLFAASRFCGSSDARSLAFFLNSSICSLVGLGAFWALPEPGCFGPSFLPPFWRWRRPSCPSSFWSGPLPVSFEFVDLVLRFLLRLHVLGIEAAAGVLGVLAGLFADGLVELLLGVLARLIVLGIQVANRVVELLLALKAFGTIFGIVARWALGS